MDDQHRSPHSPGAAFAQLTQSYAQVAQRYAHTLVRRSRFLCFPDQDDIYALGMTKIWQTYFRQGAQRQYQYRSSSAELALIKTALRCAANDLIQQRRRESQSLRPVELDALAGESDEHERWGQSADFAEAIHLKLDIERLMEQFTDSALAPVALYLSGYASRAQLAHYNDGNLRTCESRLRQKIKAFLRE